MTSKSQHQMKPPPQTQTQTQTQTQAQARRVRPQKIHPEWTTSTEITHAHTPSSKSNLKSPHLNHARIAFLSLDARLTGRKHLLHAPRALTLALSHSSCHCRLTKCSSSCPCLTKSRSCDVECGCHGACCNSVVHTPKLGIRSGALGEELYAIADLVKGTVAFVICGRVMTVGEYWKYSERYRDGRVRHYGFAVKWMGMAPVKYMVDPFEDVTGAVNHSCEPNVVVEACWANGKVYAVGRTKRNVMAKEALTVDYKWKVTTNPKEFAEICRCREASCRGLIAEKSSKFIEVSTLHYESEIARLQEQHAVAEEALQEQYETLAVLEKAGSADGVVKLEMELIRKEDENEKLKAQIEVMVAAVTRSRASLWDGSAVTTCAVEIPEVKKNRVSRIRKLMRRIRSLFSHKRDSNSIEVPEGQLQAAEIVMPSETNPCFAPDSALSSQRIRVKRLGAGTPKSSPSSARGPRHLTAP